MSYSASLRKILPTEIGQLAGEYRELWPKKDFQLSAAAIGHLEF